MDKYKTFVILMNHFLMLFNITKGEDTTNSVADNLKNKGSYLIYDFDNNIVGDIKINNNNYILNAMFNDLRIIGMASIIEDGGFDVLKMTYKVKNVNNNIEILGNYTSNLNDEKSKKYLRNKITTKNSFAVNYNGEEIGYIRFYSIKNKVYICNRLSDEYVDFSNYNLNHKVDGKRLYINYDKDANFIETAIKYDDEEIPSIIVGYEFNTNCIPLLYKEYKKIIDEFDTRYYDFINEQKNLLDQVQENYLIK